MLLVTLEMSETVNLFPFAVTGEFIIQLNYYGNISSIFPVNAKFCARQSQIHVLLII